MLPAEEWWWFPPATASENRDEVDLLEEEDDDEEEETTEEVSLQLPSSKSQAMVGKDSSIESDVTVRKSSVSSKEEVLGGQLLL